MQQMVLIDERGRRHEKLLEVLEARPFANQGEIVEEMGRLGFDVTQSSISRDFHELGVVKITGRYVAARQLTSGNRNGIASDLIKRIEAVGPNLVVIRTDTGGAPVIATAIDRAELDGVVGTLAGDDTLFVATHSKKKQTQVISKIMQLF